MRGKAQLILIVAFPLVSVKGMTEIEKSPFRKYHNNNCVRQELLIDA